MRIRVLFPTVLAALGVSAFGTIGHKFVPPQITEANGESLKTPWGLAFASSGDLFVADASNKAIDVFDPSNAFISPPLVSSAFREEYTRSVAVAATGYVYVAESGSEDVDVFKPEGSNKYMLLDEGHERHFGGFIYVAVDNSSNPSDERKGDVYVLSSNSNGTVYVIKPNAGGELEEAGKELSVPGVGSIDGLAVSAVTGNVYVAIPGGKVDVFNDKGEPEEAVSPKGSEVPVTGSLGTPVAVGIDPSNGEVYVVDAANKVIDEFSKEGKWVATIKGTKPVTPFGAPLGVAVNPTTHDVYVSDGAAVDAFGPDETGIPPVVSAKQASEVTSTTARLEGEVNPEGSETGFHFSYARGSNCTGPGSVTTPISNAGEGKANVNESEVVPHEGAPALEPNTQYTFCLIAENGFGTSTSNEEHFTTEAVPVTVEAESVSAELASKAVVGQREVTFTAQVSPSVQDTATCVFEYAKSGEAYNASVPCEPTQGSTGTGVTATVNGLEAGVDYHYRVVATNKTGMYPGADQVFGPPTVVTGGVLSEVPGVAPSTTATVGGEVDPEAFDTHYYVQYGTSTEYGQSTPLLPGIDAGSGSVSVALGSAGGPPTVVLEGLAGGALYYYRLVATNADGTTYGNPMTVRVLPAPSVGPTSVSEVTQSTATITTSVNPEGLHSVYKLDIGTSTAYGTPYPGDAGSGSVAETVTFNLTGLEAGTNYHYRLVAANSNGLTIGPDQTLTTTAVALIEPPVLTLPVSPAIVPFAGLAFPADVSTTMNIKAKSKTRGNARKLKSALKVCKRKAKRRRASCERQAHKRYRS
jgi:DNA-binding beta-propeller fold protein YncE